MAPRIRRYERDPHARVRVEARPARASPRRRDGYRARGDRTVHTRDAPAARARRARGAGMSMPARSLLEPPRRPAPQRSRLGAVPASVAAPTPWRQLLAGPLVAAVTVVVALV